MPAVCTHSFPCLANVLSVSTYISRELTVAQADRGVNRVFATVPRFGSARLLGLAQVVARYRAAVEARSQVRSWRQ